MYAKHVEKRAEFDTGPQYTGSRQSAKAHTWPNPPKLIPKNVAGPGSRCKARPERGPSHSMEECGLSGGFVCAA